MAFVKGQSGNPGGRPKENKEVQELARQYTEEAIDRLVYWMRSDNAKASTGATALILDRAWGKATQAHEHTGKDGGPIETASDRDLARATIGALLASAEIKE